MHRKADDNGESYYSENYDEKRAWPLEPDENDE